MTNFIEQIKREPALLVEGLTSLLTLVIAFWPSLVSGDQQIYLVALFVAIGGVVKAFLTKPFAVTALTDLLRAGLVVAASFGVGITANQIAVLVATVGLFVTAAVRGQITPRFDPVVKTGGAGAGPVAGEAGYAILSALGLGLIVLAVIFLVLSLLKVVSFSLVALIVMGVIGLVLIWVDGGGVGRVR